MKPAVAAFGIVLAAFPAYAQNAAERGEQVRQIERQIEQERTRAGALDRRAAAEQSEFEKLQETARAAAAAAMAREDEASDLELRLAEIDAERGSREAAIANRRGEIAALAGALQRLARQPPEALALDPATPLEAARTATLVGAMVGTLERQAQALKEELAALTAARQAHLQTRTALAQTLATLAQERERLETALVARARAVARLAEERSDTAARIARLGRESAELLGKLEPAPAIAPQNTRANARSAPVSPADLQALPGYRWPARGRIVENWGQAQQGGQIARGLTIEPREAASLVAPADGTVAFAGTFRGYGQILILEHGGGYHSILAQLSRIDAAVGQTVTAGEPVGRAGIDDRGMPVLYLELRRNGQPVDPTPWLQTAGTSARR
ncbi:MAG: peptidoglycan DD-metalloendopeptidase family protein [Telmatospirillum sp.]|nr:peptidoglycan DD-metalloendopeptidase family protein [Telmatospirillum sp.]